MAIIVATDEQTFAADNGKLLQWRLSLAGDAELRCSPSTECDRRVEHRYDWSLGIAHVDDDAPWGSWMTEAEMIAVQLLIRTPREILCTEDHPQLLSLYPSKDTQGWFDRYGGAAVKILAAAAQGGAGLVPGAKEASKAFSMLSQAFPKEGADRHWYMYRFLDPTTRLPAIEWNVLPKALEEGGPLLRGSIHLGFHGCMEDLRTAPKVEVMLRAGIRFRGSSWLQYSRPCSDLGQRLFPDVMEACRNAAELERKMKLLPQLVVESQLVHPGASSAERAAPRQRRREAMLAK